MVHFSKINWIHLGLLKQHYLQIGTELKMNFETHHHSRISFNSSLKFVLHFAGRSMKQGLLPANCKIIIFLSHITPPCFFTGLQFYITREIYYIITFYIHWKLILFSLLSLYLILPSTQGCIHKMTSNRWSSKVAILSEQTYYLILCRINLFRSFSQIR